MKGLMLKKGCLVAGTVLVLVSPFDSSQIHLLGVYKTGRVLIELDPSFGKTTDWGSFFFDDRQDIAMVLDGSVFAANQKEHAIHKFDGYGQLIKNSAEKVKAREISFFPAICQYSTVDSSSSENTPPTAASACFIWKRLSISFLKHGNQLSQQRRIEITKLKIKKMLNLKI